MRSRLSVRIRDWSSLRMVSGGGTAGQWWSLPLLLLLFVVSLGKSLAWTSSCKWRLPIRPVHCGFLQESDKRPFSIPALREASSSNNGDSSLSSQKIQEMAMFLSMAMTQSLITTAVSSATTTKDDVVQAKAVPVATGTSTRETTKKLSSSGSSSTDEMDSFLTEMMEGDDTLETRNAKASTAAMTTASDGESFLPLHQREGDRVIAMQDSFETVATSSTAAAAATAYISPSASGAETTMPPPALADDDLQKTISTSASTSTDIKGAPTMAKQINSLSTSAIIANIDDASSKLVVDETADTKTNAATSDPGDTTATDVTTHWMMPPPIPSAISKAFGRPLPISRQGVPPLQPDQNRTNGVAKAAMAAIAIANDNDPYGE